MTIRLYVFDDIHTHIHSYFAPQCNTIIEFIEISIYLQYRWNNNYIFKNVKNLNRTVKWELFVRHTFNYTWGVREDSGIKLLSLLNLRIMTLFFLFSSLWIITLISYGNSWISWWMGSTVNPRVEIRFMDDDRYSESQFTRLITGYYGKNDNAYVSKSMSVTYWLKLNQL